jgi:hypothetical protein
VIERLAEDFAASLVNGVGQGAKGRDVLGRMRRRLARAPALVDRQRHYTSPQPPPRTRSAL